MHPNRATSTLFSNFLLLPTELTHQIKAHGHENLTAIVQPRHGDAGQSQSMEIPVGRMSDKIALPPQVFLQLGYRPGDPMQFRYDGKQLNVRHISGDLLERIDDCETDEDGVRIPPAWLIQAFTGGPDSIDHIESGKRSAAFYVDLYNEHCGSFANAQRVLDFGCGCGRVLSRMPRTTGTEYFGVDLRDDALQWLERTMPDGTFSAGTAMPPVEYDAEYFDLIYSISVLTHLTQEQERAWLDEWHRLLKVGGHLIVTFRGEDWVEQQTIERQRAAIQKAWLENDGFCYQKHRYWEGIFPEFYSGTYQTVDYVRKTWGKRFEILTILPAANTPNQQNTVVMRKSSESTL